ncbi:MAG: hypothetical protein ABSC73_09265 [Acidimicrobiales bacterium]|jgi:hypothetical protein
MRLSDPTYWQNFRDANPGPHGQAIAVFALLFAEACEWRLEWIGVRGADAGAATLGVSTFAGVAEAALGDVRAERARLSRFEYGVAITVLGHAWYKGPELIAWHNLRTAPASTRGRVAALRASSAGVALNPALYAMTGKLRLPWRRRRR